ncbi:MAG TPA: PAS domain S-box protein [Burkholderiales bacterium]|nr:PAS domain S-box protein [Burkholderiales bacterium]
MSLRFRINLVITLVMIAFTVGAGHVVLQDMRRSIREEMEAGTRVTVQLMETVIAGVHRETAESRNQALLAFLRHVGRVRANEIRLYDEHDRLIYESPPPIYKAGRWAPDWFARLVGPKLDEFRLNLPGGTVVITPDASRSILDAWDDTKNFLWIVLGFFVLLNALVFWLLGRSLRPLRSILGGLSEMERGRFDVRLPDYTLPEFASISHTFNRMAAALEEAMDENRRLALVAQQASDAIMIHDLEGRVSFWNAAAAQLFEYSADEILGRSATLLTPPGLENEIAENLAVIRRRERVENFETQRMTKTGRLIDVALSAAPLIDPGSDAVIGEICALRDITEHKRMQAAERELEHNRRLTQIIQARIEEERRSIARELHDELGQCVTAIKTIGTAIANRTGDSPETHANARTIVSVASHIYDVVHGMIRQLRPSTLDHLGLGDTLRAAVANWRERHPEIDCELHMSGELDALDESVNITVYRMVQECLTNIVRHAQATRAEITVKRETEESGQDAVSVTVSDNGKGLSQRNELEATRFGLIGMRERVQGLGGRLEVCGEPGKGVSVRAVIPLASRAAPERAEVNE